MARLLAALLVGLIGAGIVHIAVLLLLPHMAERNAWSRLSALAEVGDVVRVDHIRGDRPIIALPDPGFMAAACRFDLHDGLLQVDSPVAVPFWSASIYDRNGINIFSLNDRSTIDRALDFAVLTPDQAIEARRDFPELAGRSIFAEVEAREGIVLVRAFVPDPSWSEIVARFFAQMRCRGPDASDGG
jgi:uncharacterized membrane protein